MEDASQLGHREAIGSMLSDLGAAFLLSAVGGRRAREKELRHTSAGIRTHAVVGTTAALLLLISKHGFMDVLAK